MKSNFFFRLTTKNRLLLITFFILLFFVVSYSLLKYKSSTSSHTDYSVSNHLKHANMPITPTKTLNDKNDLHLLHASHNGIKPFETNEELDEKIKELLRKSHLHEVEKNRYFELKELTHSFPYLIPEAIDMLNEIGKRFQAKLSERGYPDYRYVVTSLLRTEEMQKKLSRKNVNATNHTAHLYATTVDISYKDFYNIKKRELESNIHAIQVLTEVITEMREECKLLVVRERKQACFHITVVICNK